MELPQKFKEVLSKLNKLNDQGSSLSQRASALNLIALETVNRLNLIHGKVKAINELVNRLKSSISTLNQLNKKLTSELESAKSGFEQEMKNLEASQRAELSSEKAKSDAELAALKSSLSQLSAEDKQSALEAAREASSEQQAALRAAHEEERGKMASEYEVLNSRLLSELETIAINQANVIASLDEALMGDQGQETLTRSLVDIQNNIVSLLDNIQGELSNEDSGSRSVEQALNMPEAPQGQLLQEAAQQEIPSELIAPDIDLNAIENQYSTENIPELADEPPENALELFDYMAIIVAMRFKTGQMSLDQIRYYNNIKSDLSNWNILYHERQSIERLQEIRKDTYGKLNYLFNSTVNINPKSSEKNLSFGGRRTRRKYKRVHFKTRGKKGGKKGGKRGGKKGGKSRKGGKKGGKRTRKH